MSARPATIEAATETPVETVERIVAVALLALSAVLAGLLEVFLVPFRIGTVTVPISILAAGLGNFGMTLLARRLSGPRAGVIVLGCWLLPAVLMVLWPRPERDVLIPVGGASQWVYLGMVAVGVITAIATIFRTFSSPVSRQAPS